MPGPVTSLREDHRRAGRYLLEVAGVAVGPVSVETIAELDLCTGRDVDADSLARAVAASRTIECYDRALDALARRSRSRRDLERWLLERDYPAADIESALARLEELGLLDDAEFARGFAHRRLTGQGYGPRRVAAELARKGVARTIVDEVLGELRERSAEAASEAGEDAEDGAAAAVEAAAAKRARSLESSGLEPEVARRRLVAWLVRRGFGVGEAFDAARRHFPKT